MKQMKNKPVKLGSQTGSLFNHLYSRNATIPKVGKGATISRWTDRDAFEVIAWDPDSRVAELKKYINLKYGPEGYPRPDSYIQLSEHSFKLYYRRNAWRSRIEEIIYVKEFNEKHGLKSGEVYKSLGGEFYEHVLGLKTLIPGVTRKQVTWPTVNVIFGMKDAHYDPCF